MGVSISSSKVSYLISPERFASDINNNVADTHPCLQESEVSSGCLRLFLFNVSNVFKVSCV